MITGTPTVGHGGGGGGGGSAIDVKDVGPAGERLVVDQVVFNPNPVTSHNVPINGTRLVQVATHNP